MKRARHVLRSGYDQIAGTNTGRLEAVSDGVFAIALTLLVLDIRVPALAGIHTDAALWMALAGLAPRFLSYFLSFMTLGLFWTGHATQYAYIERSDRHLTWINLFLLMFVALLPFSAAFLSEYIDLRLAILVFWANVMAMAVCLLAHWEYAVRHDLLSIRGDEREAAVKAMRRRLRSVLLLYAIGAALCVVSTYLSIVAIVLVQLNFALAPTTWRIFRRQAAS